METLGRVVALRLGYRMAFDSFCTQCRGSREVAWCCKAQNGSTSQVAKNCSALRLLANVEPHLAHLVFISSFALTHAWLT